MVCAEDFCDTAPHRFNGIMQALFLLLSRKRQTLSHRYRNDGERLRHPPLPDAAREDAAQDVPTSIYGMECKEELIQSEGFVVAILVQKKVPGRFMNFVRLSMSLVMKTKTSLPYVLLTRLSTQRL